MAIGPQADVVRSGCFLQGKKRRGFAGVLHVHPGHALPHKLAVGIRTIAIDGPDYALVAIRAGVANLGVFSKAELG